jgi:hypothetical protein
MLPPILDPTEEQLSPYSLSKNEFRHLQAAAHGSDGFEPSAEVWNRLNERNLVYPAPDGWRLTRQGDTVLRSVTLAYGP